VTPAACNSLALDKDISAPKPALLASPPICDTATCLLSICSPSSGFKAEANIASSVKSIP